MGHYDSSRTRVVPVFSRLYCIDPTGRSWLQSLVDLPSRAGRVEASVGSSPLRDALWWPREKRLMPPTSLLGWLIENVKGPTTNDAWGDGKVRRKREALIRGDRTVIAEALKRLEKVRGERDWAILEGPSQPDVFLETDEVVVVIEGKRTESSPTTATAWMPVRHQMLRHLDGAWEIRGSRSVYGFFIVEGAPERPGDIHKCGRTSRKPLSRQRRSPGVCRIGRAKSKGGSPRHSWASRLGRRCAPNLIFQRRC